MSLDLEITGIVHSISPTKQITDSFQKRDAIIKVDEIGNNGQTYTQHVNIEIKQKACEYWDGIKKGDAVVCQCNVRGRLYNRRDTNEEASFTALDAWRVDVDPVTPSPQPAPVSQPQPPTQPGLAPGVLPSENDDDTKEKIPF